MSESTRVTKGREGGENTASRNFVKANMAHAFRVVHQHRAQTVTAIAFCVQDIYSDYSSDGELIHFLCLVCRCVDVIACMQRQGKQKRNPLHDKNVGNFTHYHCQSVTHADTLRPRIGFPHVGFTAVGASPCR